MYQINRDQHKFAYIWNMVTPSILEKLMAQSVVSALTYVWNELKMLLNSIMY